MRYDEKNTIVDNVLSKEEIDDVLNHINESKNKINMEMYNQELIDFFLPETIKLKIIKYCEEISNTNLILTEYQFCRYRNYLKKDDVPGSPNLTPHFDDSFKEPRFTFDYQINGNITWPIIVEGKEFSLKNNQALTFSGTHQIHWRPIINFADDEFLDMIFFHFIDKESKQVSDDHFDIMNKKRKVFKKEYIN
jgi:hypothetical protein